MKPQTENTDRLAPALSLLHRHSPLLKRPPGKIARLPQAARDTINTMLKERATYAAILARLTEMGHPNLNAMNLVRWRVGEHQDWLREQERLDAFHARQGFARQLATAHDVGELQEATLQLVASQLLAALQDYDPIKLCGQLIDHPQTFLKMLEILPKSCKGPLDLEKYRDYVQVRKEKIAAEIEKAKRANEPPGLTPETLAIIERELNLM